jgi:Fe-S-cluster containining protein
MPLAPVAGEPAEDGADCVACGRCCHHGPRTVHFLEADEARMGPLLLAEYTVLENRPPGFRFMKNDGERCAGLDVSVPGRYPCKVYEVRSEDCRIVEPGSPACIEARRLGHLGSSVLFRRSDREDLNAPGPGGHRSG